MKRPTREAIERAVIGALRSAINDHGPISADKITSAAKRIIGNLRNAGLDIPADGFAGETPPSTGAATPEKPS